MAPFDEAEAVQYVLSILPEVHELEILEQETYRFVFQSDEAAGQLPVNMMVSGSLVGPALTVLAQVDGDALGAAIGATAQNPAVGLGLVGDSTYFLKFTLFKSSGDTPTLSLAIRVVGFAHNHYQGLLGGGS